MHIENVWSAILDGQSGIGPLTRFDTSKHESRIAGEVKGFKADEYVEVTPKAIRLRKILLNEVDRKRAAK